MHLTPVNKNVRLRFASLLIFPACEGVLIGVVMETVTKNLVGAISYLAKLASRARA